MLTTDTQHTIKPDRHYANAYWNGACIAWGDGTTQLEARRKRLRWVREVIRALVEWTEREEAEISK